MRLRIKQLRPPVAWLVTNQDGGQRIVFGATSGDLMADEEAAPIPADDDRSFAIAALPREPHPDSVRLDWLEHGGMKLINPGGTTQPDGSLGCFLTVYGADHTASPSGYGGGDLRTAIDAARSSAPREGTPRE